MEKWPYAHSRTSPHIAVCTPAFLANFVKGPNVIEEDLFRNLRQIVLDEVCFLKNLSGRSWWTLPCSNSLFIAFDLISISYWCQNTGLKSLFLFISLVFFCWFSVIFSLEYLFNYFQADMLLDGSYHLEVDKILMAFKQVRRTMIKNGEIQVG